MQVDLLTKETLKQEMQNFLENETVNVAHVISLDYMDAYDKMSWCVSRSLMQTLFSPVKKQY